MEKIGVRVRQRALSGTEASTIGFVLVAYIGAFAGLGYWLDTLFKTSWIVAVGVLLGAAVGFREMFRMSQRLTRESVAADEEKVRGDLNRARTSYPPKGSGETAEASDEERVQRSRIFSVPPPPEASFEKKRGMQSEKQSAGNTEDINEDDIIRRLTEEETQEDKA